MAKFRSLKETRWTRFRAFLRGLLLYNTVYWRRASDGVDRNASRVGRVERDKRRPQVDPELLRPRVRPGGEAQRLLGAGDTPPAPTASPARDAAPARLVMSTVSEGLLGGHLPDAADYHPVHEERHASRKRRVVRRRELRDKAVDPARVLRARAEARPKRPMPGWVRWLIGWRH